MYGTVKVFTSSISSELAYDCVQCWPNVLVLAGERLLTSVHKNSDSAVRHNIEIHIIATEMLTFRSEAVAMLGYNEM